MHQPARAISLFVDERDYVCAITLAGAADGILGELLQGGESAPAIDFHVSQVAGRSAEKQEQKRVRDDLNFARNILKHMKAREQAEVSLAVETEAIYLIGRLSTTLYACATNVR